MRERLGGGRAGRIGDNPYTASLECFVSLGRQVAARMAIENYSIFNAIPGRSIDFFELAVGPSYTQMRIAFRAMLLGIDADPHDERWREVWTAMQASYRETMAALLEASDQRSGRALQ